MYFFLINENYKPVTINNLFAKNVSNGLKVASNHFGVNITASKSKCHIRAKNIHFPCCAFLSTGQ